MNLDCLVLSRDPHVIEVLRPAMEKLSIHLKLPTMGRSGHDLLLAEKYDGVVVDCDDMEDGLGFLGEIRKAASNQNSVAFAIVNRETSATKAFELGANFVMQKPVEPVNAVRCFSAALGLMLRERRRYFRVPVDMPITLVLGHNQHVKTRATNLSEGGMAVQLKTQPHKEVLSKVQFTLPGTNNSIETRASVAWADGAGRAGLKFLELPQMSREHLERWLLTHIDKFQLRSQV
jgi:DNA-binding response OmpR family regulator